MSTVYKICNPRSKRNDFRLAFCFGLLIMTASAQAVQSALSPDSAAAKNKTEEQIDALKRGDYLAAEIRLLAKSGAVQAIPELKKQFGLAGDESAKGRMASALVKLGDKDPAWWDYLAQRGQEAVDSDAPSAQQFDSNGKSSSAEPAPEFLAWAKAHSLTPEAAGERLALNVGRLLDLAESGDRRAIPLLRQGLSSPDFMIQATSAIGLAKFQDKASIPLIIGACERAPADAAAGIAGPLLDFNDPQAQSAAKTFRPTSEVK